MGRLTYPDWFIHCWNISSHPRWQSCLLQQSTSTYSTVENDVNRKLQPSRSADFSTTPALNRNNTFHSDAPHELETIIHLMVMICLQASVSDQSKNLTSFTSRFTDSLPKSIRTPDHRKLLPEPPNCLELLCIALQFVFTTKEGRVCSNMSRCKQCGSWRHDSSRLVGRNSRRSQSPDLECVEHLRDELEGWLYTKPPQAVPVPDLSKALVAERAQIHTAASEYWRLIYEKRSSQTGTSCEWRRKID